MVTLAQSESTMKALIKLGESRPWMQKVQNSPDCFGNDLVWSAYSKGWCNPDPESNADWHKGNPAPGTLKGVNIKLKMGVKPQAVVEITVYRPRKVADRKVMMEKIQASESLQCELVDQINEWFKGILTVPYVAMKAGRSYKQECSFKFVLPKEFLNQFDAEALNFVVNADHVGRDRWTAHNRLQTNHNG